MMLRMGKLADYGTVIMAYMATEAGSVMSAQKIALAIGLEQPTVSKILKILTQGKLLRSQRGSKGGYALARTPDKISVTEIIDIMEGYPMGLTECSNGPGLCAREPVCAVRVNWQQISQTIREMLGRITLAELGRPASQNINAQSIKAHQYNETRPIRQKTTEFQEMLEEG